MVSSPLVRFSSPGAALAMAHQRRSRAPTNTGPLAWGSLESPSSFASAYCDPGSSRKFDGSAVDEHGVDGANSGISLSPVDATALLSISQWRTLTPPARNLNQLCQDEQSDLDEVFVNTASDDMYHAHFCDPWPKHHFASQTSPSQPDHEIKKADVAMMRQAIFEVSPCVHACTGSWHALTLQLRPQARSTAQERGLCLPRSLRRSIRAGVSSDSSKTMAKRDSHPAGWCG